MGKHGRSCQKMNLWSFPAIVAGRQTWLIMPTSKTNARLPLKKAQQRNGGHGRICTLFPVYMFLFDWSSRQQNNTWG